MGPEIVELNFDTRVYPDPRKRLLPVPPEEANDGEPALASLPRTMVVDT